MTKHLLYSSIFVWSHSRWICPASTADHLSSQWDLQGSHHDHRLWKPAHVQHVLLESQGLPVWSPRRLCGHGANYCCWTRHWSHHRHPHLYHYTIRWASILIFISILFVRDNVELKHECNHLMHCTRVNPISLTYTYTHGNWQIAYLP